MLQWHAANQLHRQDRCSVGDAKKKNYRAQTTFINVVQCLGCTAGQMLQQKLDSLILLYRNAAETERYSCISTSTASTDKGSMGEPSSRDIWLLCLPRRRMRTASTT